MNVPSPDGRFPFAFHGGFISQSTGQVKGKAVNEQGRAFPLTSVSRRISFGIPGTIYEQAVVKTVAGFFRGNPTPRFGVTRFGISG